MFTVSETNALKLITLQPWLTGIFTKYDNDQYGFVRNEWGGKIVNSGPLSLDDAQWIANDMVNRWKYHILTRNPLDSVEDLQRFFATQKNELDEQIQIQAKILKGLTQLLTLYSIETWGNEGIWQIAEIDRSNKRWSWVMVHPEGKSVTSTNRVTFERPFYRNMTMNFHPAIIRDRKNESAALFMINNQSDTPIQRSIAKEVQTISNIRNNVTVGINWNVTANIQAGISGTDSNFGATVLASFGMSVGGETRTEKETTNINQTTQRIEETLTFAAGGIYEVELLANKVFMTREYDCNGVSDWERITLTTNEIDPDGRPPAIRRNATVEEKDGWLELMAKLCGVRSIQNDFYLDTPIDRQQRTIANTGRAMRDVALQALDESTRILEFKGSVDYDSVSEAGIVVIKKGSRFIPPEGYQAN